MTEYLVPTKPSETEFTEKRSTFIGHVWPVETEEEARARIEEMKKKYHDARHNCWCYLLKDGPVRYSDDGEPQGTAGQPMLGVFQKEGVTNVCCVVTRYFGGVLLGAGGLVRAYTQSAKDALDAAGISVVRRWVELAVECPYSFLERVKLACTAQGGIVGMDVDYSEIESLVSETAVYDSGYAYLVNTSGSILSHRDYESGTSMEEVLPEDYQIISDAANEGQVVTSGKNCIIYTTLNNGMKLVLTAPEKELLQTADSLSAKIIKMALLAVVLAVIFASFISRTISAPIKKLTNVIHHTADLDFTVQPDDRHLAKRGDEIGEMAKAIMGMRAHLKEMVQDIDKSCDVLGDSIMHLSSSADGVAQMTESNSAFTEEIAANMTESGNAIEKVLEHLKMIQENASSIEKLSEEGKDISSEIMMRTTELQNSTHNASDKTQNMYSMVKREAETALEKSKAVEKINELTGAIDAISSQTSLLALNASIEAARAGEAGRGFAVVATEIGNLASQTSETVSNINTIVGDVNEAVKEIAKCLDESMDFMGETVLADYAEFDQVSEQYKKDASVVEQNMADVNAAIVMLSDSISEIKDAVDEIGNAVNEAGTSITEIAHSTTHMAEQTGENKTVADSSKENLHMLSSIVEQFRLGQTD